MQLGFQPDDRHRTVSEGRLVEMLLLSGWAFEVAGGQCRAACSHIAGSLARWIDAGLGFRRGASGERLFDPVEAFNVMKWMGLHGLDTFWIDRFVATTRALALAPASTETPTRYAMTLRRRFGLQRGNGICAPGTKLRLRLPLPLDGMYTEDLLVTAVVAPSFPAQIARREGCLEVRLPAPPGPEVEIGAELTFVATGPNRGPLNPHETEPYLRPGEGFIRVTRKIDALAHRLAGHALTPRQAVTCFWDYILDELICGMVHYDVMPADKAVDWVVENGWFDCQLGSALLVSLCRARGIPARLLGGNLLYPLAPTNHYWAEIWLDDGGWQPFDLLSWDLSSGGRDQAWRHFFFAAADARMATQCLPLSPTGPIGVSIPPSWHLLQTVADTGVALDLVDYTGALIYGDRICVMPSSASASGSVTQVLGVAPVR